MHQVSILPNIGKSISVNWNWQNLISLHPLNVSCCEPDKPISSIRTDHVIAVTLSTNTMLIFFSQAPQAT